MLPQTLRYVTAALALAACNPAPDSATTQAAGAAAETSAAAEASAAKLLTPGPWRGVLTTQGQEIPFLFEVKTEAGKPVVYLINKGLDGEERLRCDEVSAAGDSVTVRLHVFDAALVLRADGPERLRGTWVKYDTKEPYRVSLVATAGLLKPAQNSAGMAVPAGALDGTWRVTFSDETGQTYPAIGIFKQEGVADYRATFLTSTGDYRYLAGQLLESESGDSGELKLSTFDGSHAFLFSVPNAILTSYYSAKSITHGRDTLQGDFYSGKTGHETWTAVRDDNAKLPDANTLTGVKPGQSKLDFSFPNSSGGGRISPADARYRGKVVVVQVLGSWCPNCLDESNFLAPWYEKNRARGVEVIGLGYERSADTAQAAPKLRRMRERLRIGYPVALAGQSSAAEASKTLPQLKGILAFPTTIFLDKKGNVRKVHTGFSGPGTGKYYAAEIADFNRTVDQLLAE